ncbi:unnamed protein product [Candidula unifasciata]|uniref:Ferric-chelate reductase 1 n=1 Tax=Candidula unifasciata TaxID=100452 RepID=A0A8S3Z7F4_9EUPU|nr:unnamed protein product [Candidula unifasciata]
MFATRISQFGKLLVFLLLDSTADGYSIGAPQSTCWTRYPKHKGLGTQVSSSPFAITFSKLTYTPGAIIFVTVEDPRGRWFSGLQIAAYRASGNTEEIVGEFVAYPLDKFKALTCFGGYRNMVTQKNDVKIQSVKLVWKAPSDNVGDLIFRATVVVNFEVFWIDVEGKLLSASQDLTVVKASKYKPIIFSHMVRDVDFAECGETKGCFVYPRHCNLSECLAAVSFQHRPDTDDYQFEMYAIAENWVSVGFSDDLIMGHDETVSCVSNAGLVSVQHGWNPHYHNERLFNRFLTEAEIKHSDGRVQCRFVLPRQSSVYHIIQQSEQLNYTNTTYDRDGAWHLMLAWGKAMPASDVMTIHKDMPAVTSVKVNLKDRRLYTGSGFPILVHLHASVMIIAWVFLTGIVTVMSRHYRDWLPKRRLFGTKVWFQVHRELAVLILLLNAIGLFAIFLHYGPGIRKYSVNHAYVGLAAVTALSLQVIAGFLRPGLDHKMRWYFNWSHRILGQASHVLAATTMFLAYDIDYIIKEMRNFGITVLTVWVVVQLLWHVVFELLAWKGRSRSSAEVQAVSEESTSSWNLHTCLLVIYTIVLGGLTAAALLAFLLF